MKPLLLAIAVALLGAGCAHHSDLGAHSRPQEANAFSAQQTLAALPVGQGPDRHWWESFGDPQLNALMAEALAASPNLQLAEARFRRALAEAGVAKSARSLGISGDYRGTREKMSEHYLYPPPFGGSTATFNRLTLDLSYDLDLWGRTRSLLDSAVKGVQAAALERHAAELLLTAAVAKSYVDLDRLMTQEALVSRLVQVGKENQALTQRRVSAGIDSETATHRSQAQLSNLEAEKAALDEQIAKVRTQLAVLLGAGPDRGLALAKPSLKPAGALALPSVLPADLMGRRPDILAQRLRVEAANDQASATRAEFYPNVNLMAFFGNQAIGSDALFKAGSGISGLGAAIHLPIFAGGATRARLAGRYADYDAAVAQYNGTLSAALKEIADAGEAWRSVESREKALETASREADQALALAQRRESVGIGSKMAVMAAETDAIAEHRKRTETKAQRYLAAIELARALGGGFNEPQAQAAAQP